MDLKSSDPRRFRASFVTILVLVSLTLMPIHSLGVGNAAPLASVLYRLFPETDKIVEGTFLDYWNTHGGLMQQGYPVSDEMSEVSAVDGSTYDVQYFERAVFEKHPENKPPYDVLLTLLGQQRFNEKYPSGIDPAMTHIEPGSITFPETGKHLGGRFKQYWDTHGGLAQQGYPISEEFTEISDLDSKPYTVQYFERAVLEYHPENRPPYDVLLSQLGTFRYRERYLQSINPEARFDVVWEFCENNDGKKNGDGLGYYERFCQSQFDTLNKPGGNGRPHFLAMQSDNYRLLISEWGNYLAAYDNDFNNRSDWQKTGANAISPAEEAAHIEESLYKNFHGELPGNVPQWLILNEISPTVWQDTGARGDEYRNWLINVITLLHDTYHHRIILLSPFPTVGSAARKPDWKRLADKAYIGMEHYVLESNTDRGVAWYEKRYREAKQSYIDHGVPASKLFLTEHFGNTALRHYVVGKNQTGTPTPVLKDTDYGRHNISDALWRTAIAERNEAVRRVHFAGVVSFGWTEVDMYDSVTQDDQNRYEAIYGSRTWASTFLDPPKAVPTRTPTRIPTPRRTPTSTQTPTPTQPPASKVLIPKAIVGKTREEAGSMLTALGLRFKFVDVPTKDTAKNNKVLRTIPEEGTYVPITQEVTVEVGTVPAPPAYH